MSCCKKLSGIIDNYMIGDWEKLDRGFVLDKKTNESYRNDSKALIRVKCAAITLGNPLRTACTAVYHLYRLIANICKIAFETLKSFGTELAAVCRKRYLDKSDKPSLGKALHALANGLFVKMPKQAFPDLWEVIRDPLIGTGIQLASTYGILDPYNGRKMVSKLEKTWNHGTSEDDGGFYLASCFQPRAYLPPPPPEE